MTALPIVPTDSMRHRLTVAVQAGRTSLAACAAELGSRARVHSYRSPGRTALLPRGVRERLRLDPPPAGTRRIEIGSGFRPTPGYVHVDAVRRPHVEFVARGDRLPFPPGWADEILAIHMLEHVEPPRIAGTLREWRRVLRPDGRLEVHVPNGEALARAILSGEGEVWAAEGAIFGYGNGPDTRGPQELVGEPDHRVLWTFPLLRVQLSAAGFHDVRNVSVERRCYHAEYWIESVPGLCLEVVAGRT